MAQVRRAAFDTSTCLYYLSRQGARAELVQPLVKRSAEGSLWIDLPGIVHFQLLAGMYRRMNAVETKRIEEFVAGDAGIRTRAVSMRVLVTAAEVRAVTGLKTPDALVAGGAMVTGCGAIVGNDAQFRKLATLEGTYSRVTGKPFNVPRYLHLDDYMGGA